MALLKTLLYLACGIAAMIIYVILRIYDKDWRPSIFYNLFITLFLGIFGWYGLLLVSIEIFVKLHDKINQRPTVKNLDG